jgi:NTE family protein
MSPPCRAIVLSGGGARGAYEVGVLDYVLRTLPRHLGHPVRFDVITGTSVGALNAAWLAATSDDPATGIRGLKEVWQATRVSEILHLPYSEVMSVLSALVAGRLPGEISRADRRMGGLLNTAPIDALVREKIPWDRITPNLNAGHFDALSVTATAVSTGQTIVFVQNRDGVPEWSMDRRRVAVPVQIRADHCLASAAIPLLFPAVKVGAQFYCDGALRQNTPVTPALRLGADRVMIIALRTEPESPTVEAVTDPHVYPGILELAGKLLNGFLLDPLEYDLQLLEHFNDIHHLVEENFGSYFVGRLDRLVQEVRGAGLRRVDHLLIRPSRDIGEMAGEIADDSPESFWGKGPAAEIVRRMATGPDRGLDLLSYIVFDGLYATRLIEMGYVDAMAQHDALVDFFTD